MSGPTLAGNKAARRVGWVIFALGAAALVVGPIRFSGQSRVSPLRLLEKGADRMGVGRFQAAAVYPSTDASPVPAGVQTRGSFLGTNLFEGTQVSAWFQPRSRITVMLAGYPASAPNRVEVEVRLGDGSVVSIPFRGENPREVWQPWSVSIPDGAQAVRVRAVDASPDLWLAFTEPFPPTLVSSPCWPIIQLLTATCLALALLYGPGLLWFLSCPRPAGDLAVALLFGPLALAAVGLLCWALGGWVAPALVARVSIGCLLAFLATWALRIGGGRPSGLPREAAVVIGVGALLVGFAVAKANVSNGPKGELYGGSVSRSLEVGPYSDSRISYCLVQVVANHFGPFSPPSHRYYSPYAFGSRGPLAGLLAAPLVLATGAHVQEEFPDQVWRPFDPQGFAVYRIALIVLASLAAWAVFGVVAGALDVSWGLLAGATLLLSPFFVHEMFFTWPKMIAGGCVLTSFYLVRRKSPLAAGLALGAGYLFHPLAILSAPFLGLWIAVDGGGAGWRGRIRDAVRFGGGSLAVVALWQFVAYLDPDPTGRQSGFLTYFLMAAGAPAQWAGWWSYRWDSLANTFVPFHFLSIDPGEYVINSVYGRSDSWIHFSFLYWCTYPFAIGLLAYILTTPALIAAAWRTPAAAFAVVFGPGLLLVVYMGAGNSGLMRYCGHALFLSCVAFSIWSLAQPGMRWRAWAAAALAHPLFLALRALEVGWMAFAPTLHGHIPRPDDRFFLNDRFSLAVAAACLAAAFILLARGLSGTKWTVKAGAPKGFV